MVTHEDVEQWVQQVDYWPTYKLSTRRFPWGTQLRIRVDLPDRDDPSVTTTLDVHTDVPMPLVHDRAGFLEWLRWRLGVLALHEVDEGLMFQGQRLNDPHGWANVHSTEPWDAMAPLPGEGHWPLAVAKG